MARIAPEEYSYISARTWARDSQTRELTPTASFGKRGKNVTRRGAVAALIALIGLAFDAGATSAAAACAEKSFDGAKFIVCTFDPRHDDIRLFWKGPDDRPYGSLSALANALGTERIRLRFAMNAGMFADDQSPIGLCVENRRKRQDAATRSRASNFHMKPNGVVWAGDRVAGGTQTSRYLASPPAGSYTTQSAPMLLAGS